MYVFLDMEIYSGMVIPENPDQGNQINLIIIVLSLLLCMPNFELIRRFERSENHVQTFRCILTCV